VVVAPAQGLMKRALAALAVAALLAAPGCARKPSSWKEWMDEAPAAMKAGNYAAMFDDCRKAFDYATVDKVGPQAVAALECMALAAENEGKIEKAFPAFEAVLRDFDEDLRISGGALRLRNNYGVALVEAGHKQEGVDLLDASLDAYEGTPQRSKDNLRVRLLLVANLARAVRVFPDSEPSIRVSTDILKEITNHLENQRYRNNLVATLGTADAMTAIAELVRLRGDPAYAQELLAQAKDQLAVEDEILAGEMRRIACQPVIVRSLVMRPCYASLR
jgi:tetratricopeptide (TPR) repeat protein